MFNSKPVPGKDLCSCLEPLIEKTKYGTFVDDFEMNQLCTPRFALYFLVKILFMVRCVHTEIDLF